MQILTSSPRGSELFELNTSSKNTSSREGTSIFGEDGFTFGDILDIVNPLHHIPLIGTIYRKISGDTIAPAMEIAGGALFGGPLGAAISVVTTAFNSQFNDDSADPDSPYIDKDSNAINPSIVASNTSQQFPKTINSNDYSQTSDTSIKKTDYTNQPRERSNGWVLNSGSINKESYSQNTTKELNVSLNTLQNKPAYRHGDGIVNPAHKGIESYTNVVTSNKTPAKSIDIIIGSRFGSG